MSVAGVILYGKTCYPVRGNRLIWYLYITDMVFIYSRRGGYI